MFALASDASLADAFCGNDCSVLGKLIQTIKFPMLVHWFIQVTFLWTYLYFNVFRRHIGLFLQSTPRGNIDLLVVMYLLHVADVTGIVEEFSLC